MNESSYQRKFNPKRRLHASQEYQDHRTKTTEKAISKLEPTHEEGQKGDHQEGTGRICLRI